MRLKDVRGVAGDDLRQLETYALFAAWNKDWISDTPWAPTPSKFEFIATPGRLDVAMKGTMARADFDACARGLPDGGGCNAFPLELTKAGYAVKPELLALKTLIVDPKAKSKWAVDAGQIAFTVRLSGAHPDTFINDGPSLVKGHTLWTADPAKAAETVEAIKTAEGKRAAGTDWAVPACKDEPWCGFRTEALERDRARLVFRYLEKRGGDVAVKLPDPPAQTIDYLGSTFVNQVPKDSFAAADDLKLRVVYDLALLSFRDRGSAQAPWSLACRPDSMKKSSLKDFCGKLGVK